jgi:hypothetical protein
MKISFSLIIGVFLGVAGTGIYIHHCFHEAHAHQGNFNPFLDKLTTRLGLSNEQRESIKTIFQEFGKQLEAARLDTNSKLKTLRDASNDKIRAVLNDDQKQKFNDMITKWEATHKDPKGWNVPGAMPPPSLGALVPRSNSPPTPSDGKP